MNMLTIPNAQMLRGIARRPPTRGSGTAPAEAGLTGCIVVERRRAGRLDRCPPLHSLSVARRNDAATYWTPMRAHCKARASTGARLRRLDGQRIITG